MPGQVCYDRVTVEVEPLEALRRMLYDGSEPSRQRAPKLVAVVLATIWGSMVGAKAVAVGVSLR